MLEVRDLHKNYLATGGRSVLTGVDLSVRAGEIVAIMGESGAGKSTLLNLIAGLDQPDRGSIRLAGVELTTLGDRARTLLRRRQIGFIFQAFHLLPHLSALDNVRLPLDLDSNDPQPANLKAHAALAAVGLAALAARLPRDLSGGEQQRVAIARAFVHKPSLILADEPTGNLDADTGLQVLALLRDAAQVSGAAVILVTHSAAAAASMPRTLTLTAHGLRAGAP